MYAAWKTAFILSAELRLNLFCSSFVADFGLSYACNGELLDHIKHFGKFDLECATFYSAEIITALEYLHSLNIIHR